MVGVVGVASLKCWNIACERVSDGNRDGADAFPLGGWVVKTPKPDGRPEAPLHLGRAQDSAAATCSCLKNEWSVVWPAKIMKASFWPKPLTDVTTWVRALP
jgi:hypothetical protein